MHDCDVRARHKKLPAGFIRKRAGSECPFGPNDRVELMIRTADGIGSTGVTPMRLHDWDLASDELGGIVGYRAVAAGDSQN